MSIILLVLLVVLLVYLFVKLFKDLWNTVLPRERDILVAFLCYTLGLLLLFVAAFLVK